MSQTVHNDGVGVSTSTIVPGEAGLLCSKPVPPGTLLQTIDQSLLALVDNSHLHDTCSNCFTSVPSSPGQLTKRGGSPEAQLRSCTACKTLKYCSKACQAQSWRKSHRFECKLFARAQPKVMPAPARALLQLLLRKEKQQLSEKEWTSFTNLKSHYDEIKREGGAKYQGIALLSKGARSYSGSDISQAFAEELYCKIMINSLTLVTSTFDPLGTYLDPATAAINHSCNPNSVVVYDGPRLFVRAMRYISQGEEVTISYVDCTNGHRIRVSELKDRYFFDCTCDKCRSEASKEDGYEDLTFNDYSVDVVSREADAFSCLDEARRQAGRGGEYTEAIKTLKRGLKHISIPQRRFPYERQPSPSLRQQLSVNYLSLQEWSLALIQMLITYFYIDPVLFEETWHPVRVVHHWTLVSLMLQIAYLSATEPNSLKPSLAAFDINYGKVIWGILQEVASNVDMSHGYDSSFAAQVRAKTAEVRSDMTRGGDEAEQKLMEKPSPQWLEGEWTKLRKVADLTEL